LRQHDTRQCHGATNKGDEFASPHAVIHSNCHATAVKMRELIIVNDMDAGIGPVQWLQGSTSECYGYVLNDAGRQIVASRQCPSRVTCGRRPGKNFLTFAALVGCGHVSGLLVRQVWPLALMLCADRVPNKNAHLEEVR
jgi:hypothetical protein